MNRTELSADQTFLDEILDKFVSLGKRASFHYAADHGNEWMLGSPLENECVRLYNRYPQLQDRMREEAKGFLWSLERRLS